MQFVIGWLTVKPGKRDQFMAVAEPAMALIRKEDGCMFYECHPSTLDPNLVIVIEGWQSPQHHQAHQTAPHHIAFGNEVAKLAVEGRFEEIEAARVVTQRPKFESPS